MNESILDFLPKNLDDIIRLRRDIYQLRLAYESELIALPALIEAIDGNHRLVKAEIDEWRVLKFDSKKDSGFMTVLGYRDGRPFITSMVLSIDRGNGFVMTKNSLYRLKNEGSGEPNLDLLMHICAVFWQWGLGPLLDVPQVFY